MNGKTEINLNRCLKILQNKQPHMGYKEEILDNLNLVYLREMQYFVVGILISLFKAASSFIVM